MNEARPPFTEVPRVSEAAARIARNYPVTAAFVQLCLDDLNADEALTRQWLDAQAPFMIYLSPRWVREMFVDRRTFYAVDTNGS